MQLKKEIRRRGMNMVENKEEEFFKMTLLSYQIKHRENMKIMKLDYKNLYKQATE